MAIGCKILFYVALYPAKSWCFSWEKQVGFELASKMKYVPDLEDIFLCCFKSFYRRKCRSPRLPF